MKLFGVRLAMDFDVRGGVGHTQRKDRGVEIPQRRPINMRSLHGGEYPSTCSRDGIDMEYAVTHFRGLPQQSEAKTDGLLAIYFGGRVPSQDDSQRSFIHSASVVANMNGQSIAFVVLNDGDA